MQQINDMITARQIKNKDMKLPQLHGMLNNCRNEQRIFWGQNATKL